MEDFIFVVVNELHDTARQKINYAARYNFGWEKLDYIIDYPQEKIYKSQRYIEFDHQEDFASIKE